jgi:hypothetical protein
VYALEGAYDFHSEEYDYADFIVRVKTNLHDSPVGNMTAGEVGASISVAGNGGARR